MRPEDSAYLAEAVALARRGLYTTTPNPRVGCVIVRAGEVLGRGWHQWPGEAHAEVRALHAAKGDATGATAYVSLEPCCIHGRTPPCTEALLAAGVRRVVVGALDEDPRVNGRGVQQLQDAGLEVELANLPDAQHLNACQRHRLQTGRPWVRVKLACSLDGRTAMASGESQWITGPKARQDVQHWRARSCAVITGIGTLVADDPRLNVRGARFSAHGRTRQPLRVVVDSRLRTPAAAQIFDASGEVLIAHAKGAESGLGAKAECLACGTGDAVDLSRLLHLLGQRPCNEVLLEAGPTLSGAFVQAGLWDEMLLYLAPKLLGSTARPLLDIPLQHLRQAIPGRIMETQALGSDLRVRLARI